MLTEPTTTKHTQNNKGITMVHTAFQTPGTYIGLAIMIYLAIGAHNKRTNMFEFGISVVIGLINLAFAFIGAILFTSLFLVIAFILEFLLLFIPYTPETRPVAFVLERMRESFEKVRTN